MNKVLIIDNFDSFTYTIKNYIVTLGNEAHVVKNNDDIESIMAELQTTHLVLSPGPGSPKDAGKTLEIIRKYHQTLPILGICLGHQCIAEAFGANIVHAHHVMHGKVSTIYHNQQDLFKAIPNAYRAMRYHSLIIDKATLSKEFAISAWTQTETGAIDEIMAIKHERFPLYGVQYHPESILTEYGYELLNNFLGKSRFSP